MLTSNFFRFQQQGEDCTKEIWTSWRGIELWARRGWEKNNDQLGDGAVGWTGETEAGKGWDRMEEDNPLVYCSTDIYSWMWAGRVLVLGGRSATWTNNPLAFRLAVSSQASSLRKPRTKKGRSWKHTACCFLATLWRKFAHQQRVINY